MFSYLQISCLGSPAALDPRPPAVQNKSCSPKASSVITLERAFPLLKMLLLSQLPRPQNAVVILRCDIRDLSLNSFLKKTKPKSRTALQICAFN